MKECTRYIVLALMLQNVSFNSETDEVSAFFVLVLTFMYFLHNLVLYNFISYASMFHQKSRMPFLYVTFFHFTREIWVDEVHGEILKLFVDVDTPIILALAVQNWDLLTKHKDLFFSPTIWLACITLLLPITCHTLLIFLIFKVLSANVKLAWTHFSLC